VYRGGLAVNPKDAREYRQGLAVNPKDAGEYRQGLAVHPGRLAAQSGDLAEDSKGLVFLDPAAFLRRVRRPAVTGG